MFRKRVKREFPPGTFIPTPARVMAILQLSLALMVLLWHLSQPFLGDLFAIRSKMAVYEFVMGFPDGTDLRARNAERFAALPPAQQTVIADNYNHWQHKLQDTFLEKLRRSFAGVLIDMPLFEKLWLLLSLVVPVLVLLKVDGAVQAAWLLPIAVFAYAADNRWNGSHRGLSAELQLFPTEAYLVENYGGEDIDPNSLLQKEQLEAAWLKYLAAEWSPKSYTQHAGNLEFKQQAEEGEYAFTTARVLAIELEPESSAPAREASSALAVYLLWNIAFAYVVTKYRLPGKQEL